MSNLKTCLRTVLLGYLILTFTLNAHASDVERITRLENEIQELKRMRPANPSSVSLGAQG
jgi:hypothetical protein